MYQQSYPNKHFKRIARFLNEVLPRESRIFDLGVINPFSKIMEQEGYHVIGTQGENLDLDTLVVQNEEIDAVSALEIFEHILPQSTVLHDIKAKKLDASVPLKFWFSWAYQRKMDKWDRHCHEFEDRQLDWLLEKSGYALCGCLPRAII